MTTEEYEHWVQETCTANMKVRMRSASGTASIDLPSLNVLGADITLAGVSVRASVTAGLRLSLSASLTFEGTSAVYAGGRVQQTIKVGCRDECRPFTSDIIFERTFQALNYNNFEAVDGVRGTLDPSVSFTLTAGIMGNLGSLLGDWGFKLSGGVKLSLPSEMRMGSLSAISNPSRFYITGGSQSLAACARTHTFDAQIRAKLDFLFLDAVIAIYWTTQKRLINPSNLQTFDLIIFCSGEECQPGQYLSSGSCRSCAPGSYKGSAGKWMGQAARVPDIPRMPLMSCGMNV